MYVSSTLPGWSIIVFSVTALNFKTTNSTNSCIAAGVSVARLSKTGKASGGNCCSIKARISASLYSVNTGMLSTFLFAANSFSLALIPLRIVPTFSCLLFFCLSVLCFSISSSSSFLCSALNFSISFFVFCCSTLANSSIRCITLFFIAFFTSTETGDSVDDANTGSVLLSLSLSFSFSISTSLKNLIFASCSSSCSFKNCSFKFFSSNVISFSAALTLPFLLLVCLDSLD